jgi:hypothetical protein
MQPVKLVLIFAFSTTLLAQSGTGLLNTNRMPPAGNWAGVGATIATRSTQCGSTIAAGASAATIQAAVAACTSGDYVLLGPGTFSLSTSLVISSAGPLNVTLRGSGPTSTILSFTGTSTNCNGIGAVALCVTNGDSGTLNFSSNIAPVTAGTSQGSTSLTVGTATTGSLSNLKLGSLLQLVANDEATDNGNWWSCGTSGSAGVCSQQGVANAWHGNTATQIVKVTNISGSTVTITPGIYAPDWGSGRTVQAAFSSSLPISGFGIENLTVSTQPLGDIQAMAETQWAYNDWAKNVSFVNAVANNAAARKHFENGSSAHVTIRDSYFYGASPTSEAYGIDMIFGTSDSLAENNICHHIATCTILETGTGNVFGYNYAADNFYIGNPPGSAPNWQQCDAFHHDAGDFYNLWEGHEGICAAIDDLHGPSFALTYFRNYFSGHDPATLCPGGGTGCGTGAKSQNTQAFIINAGNRYENIVMNVLGPWSGFTGYQTQGTSGSSYGGGWVNIYQLNYGDNLDPFGTVQDGTHCPQSGGLNIICVDNDPLVSSSLMRWGNYDTFNAAVRTNSGETGSSASTYPGLSSPSTSWASYPSLYLPSKPSFFGSNPWPTVGPDISGGPLPNGSQHNPAEFCYASLGGVTSGASGPLAFDANTCYGASTPTVATPTCSPTSGTPPQTVTCSVSTGGASICYTTDGSTPTDPTAGTCSGGTTATYSTALSITVNPTTLNLLGTLAAYTNSSVQTYNYSGSTAATPVWSPVSGTYAYGTALSITTSTSGCGTYIWWSSINPPTTSNGYNTQNPHLYNPGTLYAKVIGCPGYTDSGVASVTYAIATGAPAQISIIQIGP